MLKLSKVVKPLFLGRTNQCFLASSRNKFAKNDDWKPGRYPETQEEREAAAKRYGLHPKDYEPYPDDGFGFGDYPMFKPVSEEARGDFEYFNNTESKRNYNEVINIQYEWYTATRINTAEYYNIPPQYQLLVFIGVLTACYVLYEWGERNRVIRPWMKPQYPSDKEVHYTFEKVD